MLTSHYMQDIEELCDRVIIIDHGKIFFDGPLERHHRPLRQAQDPQPHFREKPARAISRRFGEVIEQTPVSVQLKVPRAKVTETCRAVLDRLRRHRHQRAGTAGRGCDSPAFRRTQRGESSRRRRPHA